MEQAPSLRKSVFGEEDKGMKCLFKHGISLDDVGVGVPDDPLR